MAAPTIGVMAFTVGDRTVRPLTADDVSRMVEFGILGEDERVELLAGALTRVSPKSPEHALVKNRLVRWLVRGLDPVAFDVRVEDPLVVPDATNLPEPDVAVVSAQTPGSGHPESALLVIEVAVSSQHTDLVRKPELYAAAEVPEYWVVDVPAGQLVRFTRQLDGRYAERLALPPPVSLSPVAFEMQPLDLSELLSGLS